MAYLMSSDRYTSHISTTNDSISSGAYPSAANHLQHPNLYPSTKGIVHSTPGEL